MPFRIELGSESRMAPLRKSTFSPSSVLINPAPVFALNHLTVPFDMVLYLRIIDSPQASRRGRIDYDFMQSKRKSAIFAPEGKVWRSECHWERQSEKSPCSFATYDCNLVGSANAPFQRLQEDMGGVERILHTGS